MDSSLSPEGPELTQGRAAALQPVRCGIKLHLHVSKWEQPRTPGRPGPRHPLPKSGPRRARTSHPHLVPNLCSPVSHSSRLISAVLHAHTSFFDYSLKDSSSRLLALRRRERKGGRRAPAGSTKHRRTELMLGVWPGRLLGVEQATPDLGVVGPTLGVEIT